MNSLPNIEWSRAINNEYDVFLGRKRHKETPLGNYLIEILYELRKLPDSDAVNRIADGIDDLRSIVRERRI